MKTLEVLVFECDHPSTLQDNPFAVLWIENKGIV